MNAPPEQGSLSTLVAHIEQTHHGFTRTQLERIASLLAQTHDSGTVPLAGIRRCFAALQADLQQHLLKEERILFPYIVGLEREGTPPDACFGSAANPIRVMRMEHAAVKDLLAELRALTKSYQAGEAGFHELYAALAALDADLLQHIHLEDDLLFPRALALEAGPDA